MQDSVDMDMDSVSGDFVKFQERRKETQAVLQEAMTKAKSLVKELMVCKEETKRLVSETERAIDSGLVNHKVPRFSLETNGKGSAGDTRPAKRVKEKEPNVPLKRALKTNGSNTFQMSHTRRSLSENHHELKHAELELSRSLLGTKLQLDVMMPVILSKLKHLMCAERCSIFTKRSQTSPYLDFWGESQEMKALARRNKFDTNSGIVGYVMQTGTSKIVEDVQKETQFNFMVDKQTGYSTNSLMACAIRTADGSIFGCVQILNKVEDTFREEDLKLLEAFCVYVGLALEQSMQYSETDREHKKRKTYGRSTGFDLWF